MVIARDPQIGSDKRPGIMLKAEPATVLAAVACAGVGVLLANAAFTYAVERAVSQVVDRDSERDEPRRSRRRRPRRAGRGPTAETEDEMEYEEEDKHWRRSGPAQRAGDVRRELKQLAKNMDHVELVGGAPSMEEIVKRQSEEGEQRKQQTPQEILADLQQGNARFWMGLARRPEMSAMERRALIVQQTPKVTIVGCSDSRVPLEIVFDQGLGDIFAIRVAGNVYGHSVSASVEYSVCHLGVQVIVVMGHEGCGAVKAARLPMADLAKEPPWLKNLLTTIKQGLMENPQIESIKDRRAQDREAVVQNASVQVDTLMADPMLRKKVDAGELLIVGAFYDITSGMIDFFMADETHHHNPAPGPPETPKADGAALDQFSKAPPALN